MQPVLTVPPASLASPFRASRADAIVASLALAIGVAEGSLAVATREAGAAALVAASLAVALGTVWTSNTLAHIHLHTPIFRRRSLNVALSLWLSLVLQVPQTLWRHRHLAHHAGVAPRPLRRSRRLSVELSLALLAWVVLALASPRYLLVAHLPGWLLGLALCQLSGHYEHRASGVPVPDGVSTYGAVYNALWLNDGFHREHHDAPAAHWTTLPSRRARAAVESARSPLLRAVEEPWGALVLGWLERVVIACPPLARWVVDAHARAFARVLPALDAPPRRAAIVGGGLFPRTALVLSRLLPACELTIIDRSAAHLALARRSLGGAAQRVRFVEGSFDPDVHGGFDLVVLPLALVPSGRELAAACPVLVHAWLGRPLHGPSARVSLWLWKKVVLLRGS